MAIHMTREIDRLKQLILGLTTLVEENLRTAVTAVVKRDEKMAREAIQRDREIDAVEVDVEEECLKILALHQPVANDLRYIIGMLKINHDLERIGDLAVSIGERAVEIASSAPPPVQLDILAMAEKVQLMVSKSIDALIHRDADLARTVWLSDDEVDHLNVEAYHVIERAVRSAPEHIAPMLCLLSVSRNLERIADHATNIAKDVIYMIKGEIVRHRSREFKREAGLDNG